jgi:hypothetical protein
MSQAVVIRRLLRAADRLVERVQRVRRVTQPPVRFSQMQQRRLPAAHLHRDATRPPIFSTRAKNG